MLKKSVFFAQIICLGCVFAFPDQGKWDFIMKPDASVNTISKSLFSGSKIYVQITCESKYPDTKIKITWELRQSMCFDGQTHYFKNSAPQKNQTEPTISAEHIATCQHGGHIILNEYKFSNPPGDQAGNTAKKKIRDIESVSNPLFTITKDGVYFFTLRIESIQEFNASVLVEIKGPHGYLSAFDWPLLPFYGAMCGIYVLFGVAWLTVSFLQWRDLLRIQFWIGGVIFLGMLEKAMFYAHYQTINSTGVSIKSVLLLAEWVSCAKRTLARMLVIIVSLGFGIVKPRLGPMLHRVVGTGALYFILACVESYLRVVQTINDRSNQILVASIPLAVLDSAICWWIFTSLVQTTRTLRLRRNMVKLSLYRHFTNTLIFAVIASVIFMLYSLKSHRMASCSDWKELWVDDAFWHILFSSLLLVIMILWRPTNNNQRYAFTPLLDNPEDEDDDEEEQFVSDAYGVKMRGTHSISPRASRSATNDEDDLKWVEENIPAAIADAALPILDSDEEIVNTKFEVSKMQ
uniref:Putative lung seven transmembrane receptor n=3 Tax=Nyssomyia neivai TaxID=330878 RepID=A0A1L8DK40_9DIPT